MCIQTLYYGNKLNIQQIINIVDEGLICLVGSRMNFIYFEEKKEIKKNLELQGKLHPIMIDINLSKQEFIVATRKDVRIHSLCTGKLQHAFVGLLSNKEDEITCFKQFRNGLNFILTNQRGEVNMFDTRSGLKEMEWNHHQNEVSKLKIDNENELVVTAGYDNNLKIQKIINHTPTLMRQVSNLFEGKHVTVLALSVYHTIILVGAAQNSLQIFDYEFVRLISILEFKKGVDATAAEVLSLPSPAPSLLPSATISETKRAQAALLTDVPPGSVLLAQIVNGLAIMIVATNDGMVYILHFEKEEQKIQLQVIGKIDFENQQQQFAAWQHTLRSSFKFKELPKFQNVSWLGASAQGLQGSQKNSMVLDAAEGGEQPPGRDPAAQTQSSIGSAPNDQPQQLNVEDEVEQRDVTNSNSHRILEESGESEEDGRSSQRVPNSQAPKSSRRNLGHTPGSNTLAPGSAQNEQVAPPQDLPPAYDFNFLSHLFCIPDIDMKTHSVKQCVLVCGSVKGQIVLYDIASLVAQFSLKIQPEDKCRINYNPDRKIHEDYTQLLKGLRNGKSLLLTPGICSSQKLFVTQPSDGPDSSERAQQARKSKECSALHQFAESPLVSALPKLAEWQAHKDVFTHFSVLTVSNDFYILTGSMDQYVKVWNLRGDLFGSLNINHPLPIVWKFSKKHFQNCKGKILNGLMMLNALFKLQVAQSKSPEAGAS